MINNQHIKTKEAIESFKKSFLKQYNIELYVIQKKGVSSYTLDLDEYSNIIHKSLIENYSEYANCKSLKENIRKQELVMHRQLFFYITYHAGVATKSRLGKYMNKNHATVINGINKIQNYFDTGDKIFLKIYNQITKKIEEHVGVISNNI
tara:strand:+ start:94 stop:543 length:450 start_codon:yes stop_codon:yes gene_type:complete